MLFERQRLLLTFLEGLGGFVGNTDFQKLLFLYTHEVESTPTYEFVPYRFGAFSFSSYADKRRMVAAGLVVDDDQNWCLTEAGRQMARRRAVEPLRVARFCRERSTLRGDALILDQYRRFPYFASRSEIVSRMSLEPDVKKRITEATPARGRPGLLTIGYEGRSLEGYLNCLLRDGVTLLCDVRRNPLSRKYGFSKSTLGKACEGVGIRYEHLPELGIDSEDRRDLKTQADYDALFAEYVRESLPHQGVALARIEGWILAGERVALTCFEAESCQCHRGCVAQELSQRQKGLVPEHL